MPTQPQANYYETLGVDPEVDFAALKKAYYRRAKQCHPDRFSGAPAKAEEFKALVEAFNVLSDPVLRRNYDASCAAAAMAVQPAAALTGSIMDSLADDILEELIVGNQVVPGRTTLQTLLLDLERTERFVRFREGKTAFFHADYKTAGRLLAGCVALSPQNILYRYYLGQTLAQLGKRRRAIQQLKITLRQGASRQPPQRLEHIRLELARLQREPNSRLGRWFCKWLLPDSAQQQDSTPEMLSNEVGRAMTKLNSARQQRQQRLAQTATHHDEPPERQD